MTLGKLTTASTFIVAALTLSGPETSVNNEYYDNHIETSECIVSSKSIIFDYVDERYKAENFERENEIIEQAKILELMSRFAQEQKELDPEFRAFLDEFELSQGKSVPSKTRI